MHYQIIIATCYIWILAVSTAEVVEQKLLTLPEQLSSLPVFSGFRVTRSLVLYVCFVDRFLSFWTFSFGHCFVCSSSIYRFWLPLWYLQFFLQIMKKDEDGLIWSISLMCFEPVSTRLWYSLYSQNTIDGNPCILCLPISTTQWTYSLDSNM